MELPPEDLVLIVWRFSNYADLSGRGGLVSAGRWHTRGSPIVYCADEPKTAYAEVDRRLSGASFLLPDSYKLLRIRVPGKLAVEAIDDLALPEGWSGSRLTGWPLCQPLGDAWLQSVRTPLLKVPSAARIGAFNYLINPVHRDSEWISIVEVITHPATEAYA